MEARALAQIQDPALGQEAQVQVLGRVVAAQDQPVSKLRQQGLTKTTLSRMVQKSLLVKQQKSLKRKALK